MRTAKALPSIFLCLLLFWGCGSAAASPEPTITHPAPTITLPGEGAVMAQPPAARRMLTAGIRSGNTDLCMTRIADRLREDAADDLDRLISRIEPALVLAASILVGLILLSVMLPLLNIMNALG